MKLRILAGSDPVAGTAVAELGKRLEQFRTEVKAEEKLGARSILVLLAIAAALIGGVVWAVRALF